MGEAVARLYNFANDSAAETPISSAKVDAELNQAVASLNKKVQIKSTAPANPVDGQTWIDLSLDPPVLKIYDQTNAGWASVTLPAFAPYTAKTDPVGADVMIINDSEASNAAKKLTLENLAKAITVLPDGVANTTDAAPDADAELANKKYVDDQIAANAQVGFGDWVDKSSSYGAQQATTDGFLIVSTGTGAQAMLYTDSNTDPTTIRGRIDVATTFSSCMSPVKKGDYWKVVVVSGTVSVYWIPLGS
jgi:hypothetical protein